MKTSILIAVLIFLASCSSSRIERKIDNEGWDALADESYLRWGDKRLKAVGKEQQAVVGCYLGDAKETLKQYKLDYEKKKDSPYYWLHVGNCYFVQESWTKAEFFYRLALEEAKLPTVKSIANNNLGLIHFKYEQWEKGKEFLKASIALAPKFRVPKYNLSQLYLQFGHFDRAIAVLNEDIFRGQKDIDVTFSLANAHFFKGDLKTAGEHFAQIPKEFFRREDIAATYALYLIRQGNVQGANEIMKDRQRSGVLELTDISHQIEKMLAARMKEK
jgi:tetratricopeptide (TPR) repeat protein